MHKHHDTWSFKSAIVQSWIGLAAIVGFFIGAVLLWTPHHLDTSLLVSGLVLLAAVAAMNGFARTDMAIKAEGESGWLHHKGLKILHFITNEGELAGILVGAVVVAAMYVTGNGAEVVHVVEHSYPLVFTLYGIMSAANLAVTHIQPIMLGIERLFGVRIAIILGSLLSSLTGEPAAAVFLIDFIKERVKKEKRAEVATGLAATIGSGGGLMPYAAPPVLIVWGILSLTFGWGIPELITYIGVGCVLHVITSSFFFVKHIEKRETKGKDHTLTVESFLPLAWLAILIYWHITSPGIWLWIADAITGALATWAAYRHYRGSGPEQAEEKFTDMWQPTILGILLLGIEFIGVAADPLIFTLAEQIPHTWPALVIGLILFISTAVVSHFADNALASRVFISVPVALMAVPAFGELTASLLAACVVMGALFGGFLMIPANLPNFYIARVLQIDAIRWLKNAWRLYPTGLAYVLWIVIAFQIWL